MDLTTLFIAEGAAMPQQDSQGISPESSAPNPASFAGHLADEVQPDGDQAEATDLQTESQTEASASISDVQPVPVPVALDPIPQDRLDSPQSVKDLEGAAVTGTTPQVASQPITLGTHEQGSQRQPEATGSPLQPSEPVGDDIVRPAHPRPLAEATLRPPQASPDRVPAGRPVDSSQVTGREPPVLDSGQGTGRNPFLPVAVDSGQGTGRNPSSFPAAPAAADLPRQDSSPRTDADRPAASAHSGLPEDISKQRGADFNMRGGGREGDSGDSSPRHSAQAAPSGTSASRPTALATPALPSLLPGNAASDSKASATESIPADALAAQGLLESTETRERVFERIVQSARLIRLSKSSTFDIQLKPEFLGRMRIETSLDADQRLSARFWVEDSSVKGLLESRLHVLSQRLDGMGIRVHDIEIASAPRDASGTSLSDHQADAQASGHRPSQEDFGSDAPDRTSRALKLPAAVSTTTDSPWVQGQRLSVRI